MNSAPQKFISIDEEGYPHLEGQRVKDESFGQFLLENISRDQKERYTTLGDPSQPSLQVYIEAFDEPYVARHIIKGANDQWEIEMAFGVKKTFSLKCLSLDEWDRFHGVTNDDVSFVLSRQAQVEFFDSVEEFTDDSIQVGGTSFPTPPWLSERDELDQASFWSNIYQTETPGWELNEPSPVLKMVLPKFKWGKSRGIVLGCGSGNDAAFLADQGHIVTAVDISPEAIAQAKKKYSHIENLTFLEADAFDLPENLNGNFDWVFEHTCYCAINPQRRNDLIKIWRRLLTAGGHIFGLFFVTCGDRNGPPYGGSEWEIRQRLGKDFRALYWERSKDSIAGRLGRELVLMAQKK